MTANKSAKVSDKVSSAERKLSDGNRRVWNIAIILTIVVAVWLFWPQLAVVVFTALMAWIFYPVYRKIRRKNDMIAAVWTLLISFLVVLIPLGFVVMSSVSQLSHFASTVSSSQYWEQIPSWTNEVSGVADTITNSLTAGTTRISEQGIIDFLRTAVPTAARAGAQMILGFLSSLPRLGIALIIYIFLFVEFLKYGHVLVDKIRQISPFSEPVTDKYIASIGIMANAMVKGQLIIAMVLAAIAAGLLALLGYGHYYFIFFVIFTVLNFMPLGSGLILIPLSIYSMFTGQFWLGAVVIALYFLSGNVDPILRPRLIPKSVQLSAGATLIATFCGIAWFGILGVVYGPIVMILIVTTINLYIESNNKLRA